MKKVALLLLFSLGLLFASCSKDEPDTSPPAWFNTGGSTGWGSSGSYTPPPPPVVYYEVRFVNNSRNRYTLTIIANGEEEIVRVSGKSFITRRFKEDTRVRWNAIQYNGYLFFPTERYGSLYVDGEYVISFPD